MSIALADFPTAEADDLYKEKLILKYYYVSRVNMVVRMYHVHTCTYVNIILKGSPHSEV